MPKKILKGKVVKISGARTVRVVVDVSRKHPFYLKTVRQTKGYLVEDGLSSKEGDFVTIEETTPKSKRKRFKVVEINKEK